MRAKLNEQSNYNNTNNNNREIVRTQRMLGAFQDRSRFAHMFVI